MEPPQTENGNVYSAPEDGEWVLSVCGNCIRCCARAQHPRRDQVRPLRAGERQHAELLADWKANTDIDQDQAVKGTREWAIELPILRGQTFRDTGEWAPVDSATETFAASGWPVDLRVTATSSGSAPTVTTGAASGIIATGATLSGSVSSNGASTTVTFQYGLTTSYGSTATAA